MCSKCCRRACCTKSSGEEQIVCRAHSKRERKNHRKIDGKSGDEPKTASVSLDTETADTETIASDTGLEELPSKLIPYSTTCKVLLVGIGADEQLAGYGRHRTVHRKDESARKERNTCDIVSEPAEEATEAPLSLLEQELDKDVARLWKRNLGR